MLENVEVWTAVYAALVSSALAIDRLWPRKPKLDCQIGLMTDDRRPYPQSALFVLNVANQGSETVHIGRATLWISLEEGALMTPKWNYESSEQLPASVEPGAAFAAYVRLTEVVEYLRESEMAEPVTLVARFRDQLGNTYRSEPLAFKPSDFIDRR